MRNWFALTAYVALMSTSGLADSIIVLNGVPPKLRPTVCKNYSNQLMKAKKSYQYQRGVALTKEGKLVRAEFKEKLQFVKLLTKVMRNAGCKVN
jgi:hypothetical protein